MKKVIILRGIPASGKSTWAREQLDRNPGVYKRVNKDELRETIDNGRHSRHNEKMILAIRDAVILEGLKNGHHIIVDDTNLNPTHISHVTTLVRGKAVVEVKDFDVSLEEAITRDRTRDNPIGEEVVRRMYKQRAQLFVRQEPAQPVEVQRNPSLRDCYIFDIDGTLALNGDRSPYDWKKVFFDTPNRSVCDTYRALKSSHKTLLHDFFIFFWKR